MPLQALSKQVEEQLCQPGGCQRKQALEQLQSNDADKTRGLRLPGQGAHLGHGTRYLSQTTQLGPEPSSDLLFIPACCSSTHAGLSGVFREHGLYFDRRPRIGQEFPVLQVLPHNIRSMNFPVGSQ